MSTMMGKCSFCDLICGDVFSHTYIHIQDVNTPIATLRNNSYNLQLCVNFTMYNTYGRFCMLKKFLEIEILPHRYDDLIEGMKGIKARYYEILDDRDENFNENIKQLIESQGFIDSTRRLNLMVDNKTFTKTFNHLLDILSRDIQKTEQKTQEELMAQQQQQRALFELHAD